MELTPPPKGLGGFTLAEVLITLTIIGIVAAITLPSLLVNVNDKAWNAQRKALYARMSQAIGEMDSISGYGSSNNETEQQIIDGAAEAFIIDGLSKVYRVQNICNSNNLTACGIPSSIIALDGTTLSFPKSLKELNPYFTEYPDPEDYSEDDYKLTTDIKAAAFETVNGESIALFYNPNCGSKVDSYDYVQTKTCVNMIYDLNGLKGPNEVGKDVGFITVLYRTNSIVVAPMPFSSDVSKSAPSYSEDESDAGSLCAKQGDDSRLPDIDELGSMYINSSLIGNFVYDEYWSGSVISSGASGQARTQSMFDGGRSSSTRYNPLCVRCIKR